MYEIVKTLRKSRKKWTVPVKRSKPAKKTVDWNYWVQRIFLAIAFLMVAFMAIHTVYVKKYYRERMFVLSEHIRELDDTLVKQKLMIDTLNAENQKLNKRKPRVIRPRDDVVRPRVYRSR